MGYIKVTDNQCPIRIETLNYPENFIKDYHYILAVSKLLPSYSFPIGLDVVDKFAKIPNWLSKASRNYHTSYLLKKAIAKRDKKIQYHWPLKSYQKIEDGSIDQLGLRR